MRRTILCLLTLCLLSWTPGPDEPGQGSPGPVVLRRGIPAPGPPPASGRGLGRSPGKGPGQRLCPGPTGTGPYRAGPGRTGPGTPGAGPGRPTAATWPPCGPRAAWTWPPDTGHRPRPGSRPMAQADPGNAQAALGLGPGGGCWTAGPPTGSGNWPRAQAASSQDAQTRYLTGLAYWLLDAPVNARLELEARPGAGGPGSPRPWTCSDWSTGARTSPGWPKAPGNRPWPSTRPTPGPGLACRVWPRTKAWPPCSTSARKRPGGPISRPWRSTGPTRARERAWPPWDR